MNVRCVPPLLRALPLMALLTGSGCFRSHTIEPGTWKLTIRSESQESQNYTPPPANVEVTVDWGKEKGTEDVRVVITNPPNENQPEVKKYTLAGVLKEGEVELQGMAQYWEVRVWAKVLSPRSLMGPMFARMRPPNDRKYFEGIWRITKVQPAKTD